MFASENAFNAYAILCGYTPSLAAANGRECVALFTVRGVNQMIYGYPNEEAYWRDPRGEVSHGVTEIVGSSWVGEINAYNRASFGTDWFRQPDSKFGPTRHYFVGSKDSSAQFLARDIAMEIVDRSTLHDAYSWACAESLRRLDTWPEPWPHD